MTKHKVVSATAGDDSKINEYLDKGWLVKQMVAEVVSVSASQNTYNTPELKGKIVYLLERTE
jgi:hypothetical protein